MMLLYNMSFHDRVHKEQCTFTFNICITPPIEIGEKTPNNFVMLEKPEMESWQIATMLWQYMYCFIFYSDLSGDAYRRIAFIVTWYAVFMEIVNWVCTIILNRGSDGPLLAHIACHVDLYRVDTSESVLVIVSQATQRHHLFMSHDQHETFHLVYCVVMVFVVFSHHQPQWSYQPSATTAWHLLSRLLILRAGQSHL